MRPKPCEAHSHSGTVDPRGRKQHLAQSRKHLPQLVRLGFVTKPDLRENQPHVATGPIDQLHIDKARIWNRDQRAIQPPDLGAADTYLFHGAFKVPKTAEVAD